jgi:hypothetical protein
MSDPGLSRNDSTSVSGVNPSQLHTPSDVANDYGGPEPGCSAEMHEVADGFVHPGHGQ